jgi:hypothetical protein
MSTFSNTAPAYTAKKKKPSDTSFHIEWSLHMIFCEETKYLHEHKGKLMCTNWATSESKEVGKVECTKICHSQMVNNGVDVFETLDEHSQELM